MSSCDSLVIHLDSGSNAERFLTCNISALGLRPFVIISRREQQKLVRKIRHICFHLTNAHAYSKRLKVQ